MKTVIMLRHADVDTHPNGPAPADWPLNVVGLLRAQTLVHVAGNAGVGAIYHSGVVRTEQTVAPLAAKLHLKPKPTPETPQFVQQVLADRQANVVLIAGHSNTVPEFIAAFGAPPIAEAQLEGHDDLFVVTVIGPGKASVARLKYGSPSA